jgi:flagellar biosynthetic protein FlhB
MEINSALAMLGGFTILSMWGPKVWAKLQHEMTTSIKESSTATITSSTVMDIFFHNVKVLAYTTGPFLGVLALVAIIANQLQVKLKMTPDVISPRKIKLNPIAGFKRQFSTSSVFELVKNLAKMGVVGLPATMLMWHRRDELLSLGDVAPLAAGSVAVSLVMQIGFTIGGIYVVVGIGDYIWQKHRYEKQLRMSKSEVKQEMRQQDMAPEMKSQQRRRQREAARRRMLADVPDADVIITNPTHYSVALKYDPEHGAPQVLAKGVDLLALRIREIADEHGVTRVENRPLARQLYATVEVGQLIPPELFATVAEILAFVYRANNRQAAAAQQAQAPQAPPLAV